MTVKRITQYLLVLDDGRVHGLLVHAYGMTNAQHCAIAADPFAATSFEAITAKAGRIVDASGANGRLMVSVGYSDASTYMSERARLLAMPAGGHRNVRRATAVSGPVECVTVAGCTYTLQPSKDDIRGTHPSAMRAKIAATAKRKPMTAVQARRLAAPMRMPSLARPTDASRAKLAEALGAHAERVGLERSLDDAASAYLASVPA